MIIHLVFHHVICISCRLHVMQLVWGPWADMRRDYVTSGTALVILLCASVVVAMADSDVTDTSSSSSSLSSRHDLLAMIVQQLRHVGQANKQLRSDVERLVTDYAELETSSVHSDTLITGNTREAKRKMWSWVKYESLWLDYHTDTVDTLILSI